MNNKHLFQYQLYSKLLILFCITNWHMGLFAQTCPPEFVGLQSQYQVDNFASNYPGCTVLNKTLHLYDSPLGPDITDLSGLSQITTIKGNLEIDGVQGLTNLSGLNIERIDGVLLIKGNYNLTSLQGLESLTTVGGVIIIEANQNLSNINALAALNSFGTGGFVHYSTTQLPSTSYDKGTLIIKSNASLTSLQGLNITNVPSSLTIESNSSLSSLEGLESLISIGGDLILGSNHSMTSLDGLNNLRSVNGLLFNRNNKLTDLTALQDLESTLWRFRLTNHPALTNLSGLDKIDVSNIIGSGTGFVISNNLSLSDCAIESLCTAIASCSGCFIPIGYNAPGCENGTVVSAQCTANFTENNGNWNDASNWDNGYIPKSGTTVNIGSENTVTIDNGVSAVAKCLTLEENAKLTINGDLKLTGDNPIALAAGSTGNATICGSGTINGDVIPSNGIVISPGNSPGILIIDGDYTGMGSILEVEINGATAGTSYDQLQVAGQFTISAGAQLRIHFGFLPDPSDVFNIVLANVISGAFAPENITISGITFGSMNISYPDNNTIQLSIDAIALPVELITFQAEKQFQDIKLSWTTATESNNSGFQIERSSDGQFWKALDFKSGAGDSHTELSYSWIDPSPLIGHNYYRLKQVDFDDQFTFSKIIIVDWEQIFTSRPLSIAPNPVAEHLNLTNNTDETLETCIYDLNGRYIQTIILAALESVTISTLEWHAGVFFLRIKNDEGASLKRLVKY